MYLRKKIFALLFFVTAAFAFAQTKIENSKGLITGKLQNGMSYYIYQNKMPENRASVNVLVKAGSLQEDDDQLGMAHLIEHMCFNGTEKYDKNEVVKYYQSIGLNFGGDLNAHTGFDETVYKIQIPTDDKEKFEKGIEVLKEMTLKPTFKQENIDSEKDIIVEEWRLGQGLSHRITKVFQETLFDGSRYKERFPIGDMDIIKGTKRDVLKRYYDKWYHPENMAVVIVGDFDVKYAESIIRKNFDYKETRKFTPREEYKLKELNNNYVVFKDKEMTYVLLEMVARENKSFADEEERIKDFFKNILFENILDNKINDERNSGRNFIYEGSYYGMDLSKDRLNTFYTVINKNNIKEGIKTSVNIMKDLAFNGISEDELNLEKQNLRSSLENRNKNKESIENEALVAAIREVFLNKETFLDTEDMLKYYDEFSKNITAEDIRKTAQNFYEDNQAVILFAPDDKNISVPDKTELENIISETRKEPVKKQEVKNLNLNLDKPQIKAGTISQIQDMKEYKKIVLSNGIEFLYKQTDFEKDKIYIKLFKMGGSSADTDIMYLNSQFAPEIIGGSGAGNISYKDINSFMKGKEFSINLYINDFEQGAFVVSNNKDLKTALDYLTYTLKHPEFSETYYNITMAGVKEALENRKNSPNAVYSDKIIELVFGNNIRKKIIETEDLSKINRENIMNEYKNKFSDFKDFKGILTGALSEEKAKEILEKYFASLPVKKDSISKDVQYLDIKYPQGIIKEKVVKGVDKKTRVTLYYPLKVKYSQENSYMTETFKDILNISLIDEVREKLGGVYGISSKADLSRYENGILKIGFATDPKRADEVTEAVKKEVEKLLNGEIKKESLESIIKNYKIVYENNQKENSYWTAYLSEKSRRGADYKPYTPKEFEEKMTEENLKSFFKKIVDKNNYIQVILIPEREE